MTISIRPADIHDATLLSAIAVAAKKSWDYPHEWLELWSDTLNITPQFINNNNVWVATRGTEILGFVAISVRKDIAQVEHMWVQPQVMHQGIGTKLFRHCIQYCKTHGLTMIRIESDPNAKGFYEKFGAKQVGEVASKPPPRRLPVLTIQLTQ